MTEVLLSSRCRAVCNTTTNTETLLFYSFRPTFSKVCKNTHPSLIYQTSPSLQLGQMFTSVPRQLKERQGPLVGEVDRLAPP